MPLNTSSNNNIPEQDMKTQIADNNDILKDSSLPKDTPIYLYKK